jgi:hypothetical protein
LEMGISVAYRTEGLPEMQELQVDDGEKRRRKKMNITEFYKQHGSAGRRGQGQKMSSEDQVRMSITTEKKTLKQSMVFCIGETLMLQARWVIGDMITVFVDEVTGIICLQRVPAGYEDRCWRLTPRTGKEKGHAAVKRGMSLRAQISVPIVVPAMKRWFGIENETSYVPSTVTVGSKGIEFPVLHQATVINRG